MSQFALAVLFTLFVWWFSTGVILYVDGLPARTFKWTMLGVSGILGSALAGLAVSSANTTVTGAYCAFTCAILVWGWQEVAFLLGYLTGPRREECPDNCSGAQRASYALQAVLHHEMALVVLAGVVLAITWDAPNQTGWWTYLILWTMRQSAKLNIFLGVRNLNESFLPPHLKYLQSYFTRRAMNPLFPVSIAVSTVIVIPLWQSAMAPGASPFHVASQCLLGTLLSLAILEHWFLVLPLPSEALWKWGLRSRSAVTVAVPAEAPRVVVPLAPRGAAE
jgi:putative photosynthetic complex assembly protein 2